MSFRETLTLFCPSANREVVGLIKGNPSISGQAAIIWDYDFVYCTGQAACEEITKKNCPLSQRKRGLIN